MRSACIIIMALAACAGAAQDGETQLSVNEPVMYPERGAFGVVVHTPFRGQALKDLGVQWVRLSVRWRNCERDARGQYEWQECDRLLEYYLDQGFGVMAVLTMETLNPLYADEGDNEELVIEAISRWSHAVAQRYRGRGVLYEIGNEPEVFPMGGYWSNPVTYARMARQVAAAVKQADPQARVAALSVAWMDRAFISTALEHGLLADGHIEALTYHGYHRRGMMPESGLAEDVAWLRDQVALYASASHRPIVIDSERGYSVAEPLARKHWGSWRNGTSSEAEQAAYCARHYLETIYLGVEVAVWYKDMRGEHGYSLYYGTDEDEQGLRPMGHVYRNLAALLPDNPKRLRNRCYTISLTDPPDDVSAPDGQLCVRSYVRQVETGAQLIIAAWNPVEAFDGKILESRKRIGEHYYEAWRSESPDDKVAISTQIRIARVPADQVVDMRPYDLLASTTEAAMGEAMEWEMDAGAVASPTVRVGPMPTVLVINLK